MARFGFVAELIGDRAAHQLLIVLRDGPALDEAQDDARLAAAQDVGPIAARDSARELLPNLRA